MSIFSTTSNVELIIINELLHTFKIQFWFKLTSARRTRAVIETIPKYLAPFSAAVDGDGTFIELGPYAVVYCQLHA